MESNKISSPSAMSGFQVNCNSPRRYFVAETLMGVLQRASDLLEYLHDAERDTRRELV